MRSDYGSSNRDRPSLPNGRVRELIAAGVEEGSLRPIGGNFTGQLVALAIEGVQSGVLLSRTGLNAGQAYPEMADLLLCR